MSRTLIFLVLLLIAAGCIYDPKGKYVDPIAPPDGSDAAINLEVSQDPILLSTRTSFTFHILSADRSDYAIQVRYDNALVYDQAHWSSPNITFSIDPGGHPTSGKLVISVSFLSHSASIAGQLGTERETVTHTWDVITDLIPPQPIGAPTVTIENGKSMIRWTSPSKFNIKEMLLIRIDHTSHLDTFHIADIHSTEFHDNNYVGGNVQYRVDMKSATYVKGATTSFTCLPFNPILNTKTGVVTWEKPLLYGNGLSLRVNDILFPWDQPGSYDAQVLFGETEGVRFVLYPAEVLPGGVVNPYAIDIIASRGEKLPANSQTILYHAGANAYFMRTVTEVVKIDATTMKETGRLYVSNFFSDMVFSRNGTYAYLYDRDYLFRFNPVTMTIQETMSWKSIMGGPFDLQVSYMGGVSNDNLLLFTINNTHYVFDMNTKTKLWEKTPIVDGPSFSPDGNFITERANVYKRNGNNWDLFGTAQSTGTIYLQTFIQENGNNMALAYQDAQIVFYDLSATPVAGALQQVTPLAQQGQFSYDSFSKSLAVKNSDKVIVYDISDWQQRRTLDGIGGFLTFVNDVLFSTGYYYPNN